MSFPVRLMAWRKKKDYRLAADLKRKQAALEEAVDLDAEVRWITRLYCEIIRYYTGF